jgi:hydrogenase nickel incorporation protein HypA/HybF
MHELGIVAELVDVAAERTKGARVKRLVLEIGKLSSVLPDAVRFCFEIATEGTPLEGATLEISEVNGTGRCRACDGVVVLERPVARCACGAFDLEWVSGMEVRIVEMELL